MVGTMKFTPSTTRYTTDDGTPLVLRVDYFHGFRAYWIENTDGKKILRPRFYNPDSIRLILKSKG